MLNFEKGKKYSFITVNDAVLNQTYKEVLVLGVIDFKIASKETNVVTRHAMLWPYLNEQQKNRYSKDASKLNYFIFEFPGGQTTVLSDAWINPDSVQEVTGLAIDLTVHLNDNAARLELLNLLEKNGYRYHINE